MQLDLTGKQFQALHIQVAESRNVSEETKLSLTANKYAISICAGDKLIATVFLTDNESNISSHDNNSNSAS